jgi:hypothetical protein
VKKSGVVREGGRDKRSTAIKGKSPRAVAKPALVSDGGSKSASGQVAASVMHEVPADLHAVLTSDADLLATWNGLTPIQRNEWICWVTIVKKRETRAEHVRRLSSELREGKRQPCCWPGCPHRRPKARKWFRNE